MELPLPADVRAIFATTAEDATIQANIDDAALVAEQCPAIVAASSAKQKSIIKWLTAHMMSMTGASVSKGSGVVTSDSMGDAARSYAAPTMGANLQGTSYGQRALLLDDSGCLVSLGEKLAFAELA